VSLLGGLVDNSRMFHNFESLSKFYILTAMLYAQKRGLNVEKTLELEVGVYK
jgi:hypothetical protein